MYKSLIVVDDFYAEPQGGPAAGAGRRLSGGERDADLSRAQRGAALPGQRLDRTPPQEELAAAGYPDIATLLAQDGPDLGKWDQLMTVPLRFNRLILYRPWMWHSAAPGFGESAETGRLIQVLSFERGAAA